MATAVARRLATAVVTGLVLVPTGLLVAAPVYADSHEETAIGEPAYEEATPDPETGLYPGQFVPGTEASPATPGWITGGTLQEATAAKPAAKPVAKPRAVTTVQKAAPTRRTTRTSSVRSTSPAAGEATVLPFTGPSRLGVQLGVGAGLVLVGAFVTVATRPRTRTH